MSLFSLVGERLYLNVPKRERFLSVVLDEEIPHDQLFSTCSTIVAAGPIEGLQLVPGWARWLAVPDVPPPKP